MRLTALFFLVATAAVTLLAFAPGKGSAQSGSVVVPIKQCGTFTGPTWQFPGTSLTSNKYGAYVIRYS